LWSRRLMSLIKDCYINRRESAHTLRYDRRRLIRRENDLNARRICFDEAPHFDRVSIDVKIQVSCIQMNWIVRVPNRYGGIGTDAKILKIGPPTVVSTPFLEGLLQ